MQDVLRAQGAVIDVQRRLAEMMRGMVDGQRPKLTELEVHNITEIARMSAGMAVIKHDRGRVQSRQCSFAPSRWQQRLAWPLPAKPCALIGVQFWKDGRQLGPKTLGDRSRPA